MNRPRRHDTLLDLMDRIRKSHPLLLGLASAAALALLCLLGRFYLRHSQLPFLPAFAGAEWVLYPKPIEGTRQDTVPLTATFQRAFVLEATPAQAALTLCAFRQAAVTLNGHPVDLRTDRTHWKAPLTTEVARLLQPGTNLISVSVTNAAGPPALWLRLEAGPLKLATDEHWQATLAGSDWQPARLASRPPLTGPDNPLLESEATLDSLKRCWPLLTLFAAISVVLAAAMMKYEGRRPKAERAMPQTARSASAPYRFALRTSHFALLCVLLARAVLFFHNAPLLPRNTGFDAPAHEDYVQFILEHHALPLPSDGWEMYQPPLYYGLGAGLLSGAGYTLADDNATFLLRTINGVAGLVHCWLAFLCLRLLFPDHRSAQMVGLLLVAFLPPHLYLSQYVTNEPLAGCLVTAALYCYLRTFQSNNLGFYAGLGAALGAAMLTKVSALIPAVVLGAAVCFRFWVRAARTLPINTGLQPGESGRLSPAAVSTASQGSGKPLKRLTPPPAADTGLKSGVDENRLRSEASKAPPSIFYPLLSALAAFLLVCGWFYVRTWAHTGTFLAGNWEAGWWQDPGYRTGAFLTHFGHALTRPLFSAAYSFADGVYSTLWADGLASGAARLASRPPWNYDLMNAAVVLSAVLMVLFLLRLATAFWRRLLRLETLDWRLETWRVSPWPALLAVLGLFSLAVLYMALKVASYAQVKAFYAFPALLPFAALLALAVRELLPSGKAPGTRWAFSFQLSAFSFVFLWCLTTYAAFWVGPDNPQTHLARGLYCADHGRDAEAVAALSRALQLDTEAASHSVLPAGRSPLSVPSRAEAHLQLGSVLERLNRPAEAVREYRAALEVRPEFPGALNNLAWLLATSPEVSLRNGAEAVRLAERACTLTHHEVTIYLGTLAAAYAEAGRFPEAIATAQQAQAQARATHQEALAQRNGELLQLYRSGKPAHEAR